MASSRLVVFKASTQLAGGALDFQSAAPSVADSAHNVDPSVSVAGSQSACPPVLYVRDILPDKEFQELEALLTGLERRHVAAKQVPLTSTEGMEDNASAAVCSGTHQPLEQRFPSQAPCQGAREGMAELAGFSSNNSNNSGDIGSCFRVSPGPQQHPPGPSQAEHLHRAQPNMSSRASPHEIEDLAGAARHPTSAAIPTVGGDDRWATNRAQQQTERGADTPSSPTVVDLESGFLDHPGGKGAVRWAPRKTGDRPLDRRKAHGLSVTDFTASEWCEQRMSFILTLGKPPPTAAMQSGTARHEALEAEVVEVVEVEVRSREDVWALKLLGAVARMQQLWQEGITRELQVVSKLQGVWIVGIIDEVRLLSADHPDARPHTKDWTQAGRRENPEFPGPNVSHQGIKAHTKDWTQKHAGTGSSDLDQNAHPSRCGQCRDSDQPLQSGPCPEAAFASGPGSAWAEGLWSAGALRRCSTHGAAPDDPKTCAPKMQKVERREKAEAESATRHGAAGGVVAGVGEMEEETGPGSQGSEELLVTSSSSPVVLVGSLPLQTGASCQASGSTGSPLGGFLPDPQSLESYVAAPQSQGAYVAALIVDTKTRWRPRPPRDAQKRNSRLQLMLYKRLLDSVAVLGIPVSDFCSAFNLSPLLPLAAPVAAYAQTLFAGRPIANVADAVFAYNFTARFLPPTNDSLLLRYEWQADRSLLGEDLFEYDSNWVEESLQEHLKFWKGEREPYVVDESETWKCSFCKFAELCPAAANKTNNL